MTVMKTRNNLVPLKDYVGNSIILLSGLTSFVILLIIALYISPQGKGALSFCSPFYAFFFNCADSLSLSIRTLSGIIIPSVIALCFFAGLHALFSRGKQRMGIFFFFLGLSLMVAGYGFLVRGIETIGLLLLLIAVIVVAYSSAISLRGGITQSKIAPSSWHRMGLVIILVIATCNCFYQLEYTPYHLSGWEAGGGISALQVSHRVDPDYHRYLWSSLDRPFKGVALCPFFVYFLWGLFKIFGVSLLMLRSAGVFWGLTSLVVLYFLIKDLFGTRPALLAVFLTSISPWFLSIARLGTFISISLCYFLIVLLVFYRGLKGKITYFIIAGALLSLFRYFYIPVKILFPFLALVWLHHWLLNPGSARKKAVRLLLFLTGFFLVSALLGPIFPRLSGTANTPGALLGSSPGETGFNIVVALTDLKRNLYALFYNLFYQSHSIILAAPRGLLINRGILLLAFLGLGWAISHWKKKNYLFILLSLFLPALPVILTTSRPGGFPVAQRCFLLTPFISSSAAIMLCLILGAFRDSWKKFGSIIGKTALLLFLTTISVLNISNYFRSSTHPYFPSKRSFAEQCLLLLKEGYYLEIGESDYHSRELIEFLSYPITNDLYTYFAFYPYEHYQTTGRMAEGLRCNPIKKNPFYNFWRPEDFKKVLTSIGTRKRKTAIIFENEVPYENRPLLLEVKTFDPDAKITEIKGPDNLTIGFQCLIRIAQEN